jgi:hypothetical protein
MNRSAPSGLPVFVHLAALRLCVKTGFGKLLLTAGGFV